jgi:hypothetical protein
MKPRELLSALCLFAGAAACASRSQPMYAPTQEEQRACEALGGSIQPAFALNEYVCLLPASAQ